MEFIRIRILNKLEFIRIPLGNGINREAGDPDGWRPGLPPREVPRSETFWWLNTPYQELPTPAYSQKIPFMILRPDPELILWRFAQQWERSKLDLSRSCKRTGVHHPSWSSGSGNQCFLVIPAWTFPNLCGRKILHLMLVKNSKAGFIWATAVGERDFSSEYSKESLEIGSQHAEWGCPWMENYEEELDRTVTAVGGSC